MHKYTSYMHMSYKYTYVCTWVPLACWALLRDISWLESSMTSSPSSFAIVFSVKGKAWDDMADDTCLCF